MPIRKLNHWLSRALLCLSFLAPPVFGAALEKTVSIDVGAGVPQLMSVGAQVLIRPWLQAGLGYGLYPAGIAMTPDMETESVTLVNGVTYDLSPSNILNLSMLSPYLRIFPAENNFYFQFTYNMLRAVNTVRTNLVPQDSDEDTLSNAFIFNVTTIQPIPTVSIGHIFTGKLMFINISLGASFLLNPSTTVTVTTSLPDEVGGSLLNSDSAEQAKVDIKNAISDLSKNLQNQLFIIPSLFFSVGFVL